jgi:hypothetical protein
MADDHKDYIPTAATIADHVNGSSGCGARKPLK